MANRKKRTIWIVLICVGILLAISFYQSPDTLPNFHRVSPFLYRGGEPDKEGIARLKEINIKTIIDLDKDLLNIINPSEVKREKEWAEAAGIRFEHIPMHPLKAPRPQQVDKALSIILNPANHPVYVHCDRGTNRTGFVVGAYRVRAEGWSPGQAYKEMLRSGFYRYRLFWWNKAFFQYIKNREERKK
jgi:protein tyrosine/serine phosphatase